MEALRHLTEAEGEMEFLAGHLRAKPCWRYRVSLGKGKIYILWSSKLARWRVPIL